MINPYGQVLKVSEQEEDKFPIDCWVKMGEFSSVKDLYIEIMETLEKDPEKDFDTIAKIGDELLKNGTFNGTFKWPESRGGIGWDAEGYDFDIVALKIVGKDLYAGAAY